MLIDTPALLESMLLSSFHCEGIRKILVLLLVAYYFRDDVACFDITKFLNQSKWELEKRIGKY